MSNSLVIVAIPEESDRVWKISSEKVPHLTLLYLGDADNNPNVQQIMQFVEHATQLSEHGPFYLDVDRRGVLGEDEADVLFFSKRSWNLKWIKQFRGQLLQNQAIRTAYDSNDQFGAPQEWMPHLTLGYPETPAHPIPEDGFDHPIYSVSFDRIAVWDGDFEGPEFYLEYPDREESPFDMAMSTMGQTIRKPSLDDALAHYGVKGMQWGVRNNKGEPVAVTPNAVSKVPHGAKRKTKIETDGGENHPASEDAIKVAKARTKLKKSGPATLSNQELREVAERMRLEAQVVEMNRSSGSRFIRKLLGNQGNQLAKDAVREGSKEFAREGGKQAKKKAATVAVTTALR